MLFDLLLIAVTCIEVISSFALYEAHSLLFPNLDPGLESESKLKHFSFQEAFIIHKIKLG